MTRETADWMMRAGLVLGFVSFWFAAPEFIGQERLQKWEAELGKGLLKLPALGKAILTLAFGATCVYVYQWIINGQADIIWKGAEILAIAAATYVSFELLRP